MRIALLPMTLAALSACTELDTVGRAPDFSPTHNSAEYAAMISPGLPQTLEPRPHSGAASLWASGQQSLLGDRRAVKRGDILTVVVEIDESAEISNTTSRGRSGSESLSVPSLLGIPQRIDAALPEGATMGAAIATNSTSSSSGNGSVRRNEKLELRVAATVVEVLPNGVLHIEGSQEVRVNFEIRELLVGGYVRPQDISRRNEITYDKMASARISYGGRGQISQMQQPRYGQQIADIVLPF